MKTGKVLGISSTFGMALVANGPNLWLLHSKQKGQFVPEKNHPQLVSLPDDKAKKLPAESDTIYFEVNSEDPLAIALWATNQELEACQTLIFQNWQERMKDPLIRVWDIVTKKKIQEERKLLVEPIKRSEFIKKNPPRRFDLLVTRGDFFENHTIEFEVETPEGWKLCPDPRPKFK